MTSKTEVVFVTSTKSDVNSRAFIPRVYEHHHLFREFIVSRSDAPSAIRSVLREWITENGISSLFNYHITCDAVMHPGMRVDEIEELICGFVAKLGGVRNLFIVDPYMYSSEPAVLALFENMVRQLAGSLESVTVFSKPDRGKLVDTAPMHAVLTSVIPGIKIKDVRTERFHDRFWLDADRGVGLVMGTSLNGVTKKIALIDHLNKSDAADLVMMAQALI